MKSCFLFSFHLAPFYSHFPLFWLTLYIYTSSLIHLLFFLSLFFSPPLFPFLSFCSLSILPPFPPPLPVLLVHHVYLFFFLTYDSTVNNGTLIFLLCFRQRVFPNQSIETLDVVSASVNKDHTILAFSTVNKYKSHSGTEACQIMFDSYVVEVSNKKPQLCSLNVSSSTHQRVQFLYGESSVITRASHLLVFRHLSGIDLYTLSGTPNQLPRPVHPSYIWFQFDLSRMAVYLLYLRESPNSQE